MPPANRRVLHEGIRASLGRRAAVRWAATTAIALALGAPPLYVHVDGASVGVGFAAAFAKGSCCFVAGTRVRMADGTDRPIERIRPGDLVLGAGGRANAVTGVERVPLGRRPLHGFDDGAPFVTPEHPFLGPDGWLAVDPVRTAAENPALAVSRLEEGAVLLVLADPEARAAPGCDGALALACPPAPLRERRIGRIATAWADPDLVVYNLLLDGDHTYFADGFAVHNKGGGDGGGGDGGDGGGDGGDGGGSGGGDGGGSGGDDGGGSGGDDGGGSGGGDDSGGRGRGGDDGSGNDSGGRGRGSDDGSADDSGGRGRGSDDSSADSSGDGASAGGADDSGGQGRGRGRGRGRGGDDTAAEGHDDSSGQGRGRGRGRGRSGEAVAGRASAEDDAHRSADHAGGAGADDAGAPGRGMGGGSGAAAEHSRPEPADGDTRPAGGMLSRSDEVSLLSRRWGGRGAE